jgi:hypothetical protein
MSMQAGTYYIGDLCYVMHPEWEEFCSLTINDRECLDGEFSLADGRRFATYGTAWGDGSYPTNVSDELIGVDAGLIGCIRVEDIAEEGRENLSLGIIVEFKEDFQTSGGRGELGWDGVIKFGHVRVETDQQEEEYDNYYEDEDEEYICQSY